MNPSADSTLLNTIKEQLRIAINDMTKTTACLLSGQGIDARITTEHYGHSVPRAISAPKLDNETDSGAPA